ncbi:MAG: response regulator, partial [Acidobacteria bacterium]|nr:response regulator [Acidobacteriota bacterium]
MPKIRVLVVDDAVVFRRLVSEELSNDPALEVVGTAANGRIALAKMTQVNPDVVILDVEMPDLDGLATLKELRKTYPRLPVIMFSALTERGAEATLDALALGATDYFTKPANTGSLDASLAVIREQLIPKIKALCASAERGTRSAERSAPSAVIPAPRAPRSALRAPAQVQVLAIGTSTGGPNALAEVFRGLPADFPVPIVIV